MSLVITSQQPQFPHSYLYPTYMYVHAFDIFGCIHDMFLDQAFQLLVRVCVFLRVTAAQGWLVGQRLRTAYIASLRVRFFKVVRKQIISRHAHNLS